MARVYGIEKTLTEYGFDDKTIKEIIGNRNLINVIERMEKTLEPDIMHEILDRHACRGGKDFIARMKKIGKEIAKLSLTEKVAHVNNISFEFEEIILNDDNTLSVKWSFDNNGKYKCLCPAMIKKGVRVSELASEDNSIGNCIMPLSYCFCCAGSGRRHLEMQLRVKLKTKEVVSTPINSRGEKPCQLVFEILE